MDLQFDPIAKLPLQLLSNTQDQGPRDSTHATQACTQNTLAMWELLRLTSINRHLDLRSAKTIS